MVTSTRAPRAASVPVRAQVLRAGLLRSKVSNTFAVAIERPEGRFVVSGVYTVIYGVGRHRSEVHLFQDVSPDAVKAVIACLGTRLKGKTKVLAHVVA